MEKSTATSSTFSSWDDSASYQGRSTETTDGIRNHEVEHTVEKKLQPDVANLVSKVVGFEELGKYEDVADKVEELITLSTKRASKESKKKGLDEQKQKLCNNARRWLDWKPKGSKPKYERDLYSCFIDYIFLISMVLAEKEYSEYDATIERRILPHPEIDVRSDPEADIRYDIVLRCCGLGVNIQQEYGSFKPDANLPDSENKPNKKRKVDEPKPAKCEDSIKYQDQVKDAFGFVKVKKSSTDDDEPYTYAQLGRYVLCALDAQFDRNFMWGITVCGKFVRFILFTHSAAIPSKRLDMRKVKDRKQFVDNYIRLSLCPKYRVGYDPTKTWLSELNRWKVECFDTNRGNSQQGAKGPCETVYVDPKPITPGGSLFGRRTRCHLASLTKTGNLKYVLKESWTEVDRHFNKVEMPNEVRIFNRIREKDLKLKKPLTGKGIPEMVYGGTVCVQAEYVYGDTDQAGQWCYDTVSRYCGEFKANTSAGSNQSPSTDQGESANSGNNENDNEFVERVHQRLLLTPVCESMVTLHPHGTQSRSEIPIELSPREASDLCGDVEDIFQGLFLIIYGLYRAYGIYHRDLSEGNVLVVKTEVADPSNSKGKKIILNPLVIDFDHARFSDDVADSMSSRTGTLPFMSILNLAGRSDKLSFLDECESFLYLYLWKCTIGFTRRQVSPPAVRKSTQSTHGRTSHSTFEEKAVHQWATNASPNTIEDAKRSHMDSKENFTIVLKGLRPEFKRLRPLFHNLREALFTWTGGSGAIITEVEKTTAKVITGSTNQGTSGAGPPKLASKMEAKGTVDALAAFHQWYNEGDMERTEIDSAEMFEVEEYDPLLKRYDYEEEVLKKFHALMKPKGNTQKQLSDIVEG